MKAVNLVPTDARRGRGLSAGGRGRGTTPVSFGPVHVVVGVLVIVIALIALRVLANNGVSDKKATLAAVQTQVAAEQAQASRLSEYTSFVQAAQQREDQVRELAEQRFPWQRTLDQISRVMPATTSLTSLSATTSGSASTTSSTSATGSGPTFTLAGCANTPNQNGMATLLRRLQLLSGVTNVGFQSSARQKSCGNSFNLNLDFAAATAAAADPTVAGSTTAVPATATTATTTSTTAATAG